MDTVAIASSFPKLRRMRTELEQRGLRRLSLESPKRAFAFLNFSKVSVKRRFQGVKRKGVICKLKFRPSFRQFQAWPFVGQPRHDKRRAVL